MKLIKRISNALQNTNPIYLLVKVLFFISLLSLLFITQSCGVIRRLPLMPDQKNKIEFELAHQLAFSKAILDSYTTIDPVTIPNIIKGPLKAAVIKHNSIHKKGTAFLLEYIAMKRKYLVLNATSKEMKDNSIKVELQVLKDLMAKKEGDVAELIRSIIAATNAAMILAESF